MNAILNFFERVVVPDQEEILNGSSDLVLQKEGNADILASILGAPYT